MRLRECKNCAGCTTNLCDESNTIQEYINKVVEKLEENSVMRANSKAFYDNPQNGEYVDEVVLLSKAIEIIKAGVRNDD